MVLSTVVEAGHAAHTHGCSHHAGEGVQTCANAQVDAQSGTPLHVHRVGVLQC